MATHLDIGVVRIQRYLGRWPQLAGRRGASALLSYRLSAEQLAPVINGRAVRNDAAGDIDSIVSLTVSPGVDPRELASDILDELRRHLPAAELEASWADASDYVSAYPLMRQQRRKGGGLESLPTAHGFPLLRTCDLCGIDVATHTTRRPDGIERVCADCLQRNVFSPESGVDRRFREEVRSIAPEITGVARTFEDLSRLVPEGEKANHLAHIVADGNQFGAFFRSLIALQLDKDEIARKFSLATWRALAHAAQVLGHHDGVSHVLPHVVGGDDLLVSVPAVDAWPFALAYLDAFNTLVADTVRELPTGLPVPTASAAIVIAQRSWPFDSAAELAEELLRRAKDVGRGSESTVAWLEVTRRGADASEAFPPLPVGTVHRWSRHLHEMCEAVPASMRHNLETLLAREGAVEGRSLARREAARMGKVRELFPAVDDWELATALDLARWFR